ncbi:MAG: hypothetical protein MRK02_17910 [Candidatus Scalindua sp.]|nr:hypothetical protein [Candidatus Scalindua sp.]
MVLFIWQVKTFLPENGQKKRSRLEGTQRLCGHILKLPTLPTVFVCTSAIGFYGDRGDEVLNEESSRGNNFLSDVCVG